MAAADADPGGTTAPTSAALAEEPAAAAGQGALKALDPLGSMAPPAAAVVKAPKAAVVTAAGGTAKLNSTDGAAGTEPVAAPNTKGPKPVGPGTASTTAACAMQHMGGWGGVNVTGEGHQRGQRHEEYRI